MKNIILEEKYILEYILDILNDYKTKKITINDYKYHHNTSYFDAPSVIRYGILSLLELNALGVKNFSQEVLDIMSDTDSHINGTNAISLSVVGLKDLYHNESEYSPYSSTQVDFLISNEIKAYRSTLHYGNEFLCYNKIENNNIRSLDIRLLKLASEIKDNQRRNNSDSIRTLIDKYNQLKNIAITLKTMKLNIPVREMSNNNNYGLDIDKLSKTPKLVLK